VQKGLYVNVSGSGKYGICRAARTKK